MKIFVLHRDPATAASKYPPRVRCQAALDIAQVLSTVVKRTDGSFYSESVSKRSRLATRFYRKAQYSQQAGKTLPLICPLGDGERNTWVSWAMKSKLNYCWLLRLMVELLPRSEHGRASTKSLLWEVAAVLEIVPKELVQANAPMTPFPLVSLPPHVTGTLPSDPVVFYSVMLKFLSLRGEKWLMT